MADPKDPENQQMIGKAKRKRLAQSLGIKLSETSGNQFIQAEPAPDSPRPFVDLPAADADEEQDN
jgi:hypothetical protein